MISITSSSNKKFREFKALLTGSGVKRHGKTLVSGAKVISEVIRLKSEIVQGWLSPPKEKAPPPEMPCDIPQYRLSGLLFRELDVNGTGFPLLVVKVPGFLPFQENNVTDDVLLLVPFQDPSNVGAVIRSATAFGVTALVMLEEAANPFHPKSIRAAGTPLFTVRFMKGPSIREVGVLNRPVVALSAGGADIGSFRFPERFALLPGLEGTGLPAELKPDYTVSIPMEPDVESLNAAVAVSIVLYEYRRGKAKGTKGQSKKGISVKDEL